MGRPGAVGSVPGHAPTNPGGTPWALPRGNDLKRHQFGQPGGSDPRQNPGRPATAQQRHCMEAIQKLWELDDALELAKLSKRFPPRMVIRLVALQKASEDPGNPFFLQAQREIYKVLVAPVRHEDKELDAAKEPEVIEVRVGRIEVPMPGAPGDVPPETKAG